MNCLPPGQEVNRQEQQCCIGQLNISSLSGNLVMIHALSKTTFWCIAALYWGLPDRSCAVTVRCLFMRWSLSKEEECIILIYAYTTVGERLRGRSGVGGAAPAMTRWCARRRAPRAPSPTRTTWTSRAAAPPTAAAPATRCSASAPSSLSYRGGNIAKPASMPGIADAHEP